MARNAFGGSVSDYVVSFYTLGSSKLAAFTAATLTFYDAETGGNQVTDLALNADGSSPVTQVSVPATGDVPTFYGPDGVTQLWVSANGSASRVKMVSLEAAAAAVTGAQAAASEAAGHATDAASSATAAEQAAASVPATTDAAMAPVLSDPESASAGVLAAAIAGHVPALVSLRHALDTGSRSVAIQTLSDSTGVSTDRWPYRVATGLAAKYPGYNVRQLDWDDTAQDYGVPTLIQTATAGPRYLDCSTGTTTRRLDPSVVAHLSGIIDVRLKMSANWTPTAIKSYIGRSGANGARGWYASLQASTGRPNFTFSTDGTATTLATMTVTAAPTVAAGATTWVRWVFTPNDGAGNHTFAAYQSSDGVTWTQLSTTVSVAGTVSLFDNSATTGVELGGVASGIGDTTAKVYDVQIRNGLNGPSVVPALPDLWPPYDQNSATFGGAPTITMVNGARSGGTIAYLTDTTRMPKLTPNHGQLVTFLSSSHNEGQHFGVEYQPTYETFRSKALALFGGLVPVVGLTQNPEVPGVTAGWYRAHEMRRYDVLAYGRAKGFDVMDTYGQFLKDANWATDYTLSDGTHPNSAGSQLWADMILDAIKSA